MELGLLPYINTLPITWGLETGAIPWPGPLRSAIPSQLSRWLVEGDLPISLISSAAYLSHRDELVMLRHLSISAKGPVSSVILFTRRSPADISTVAVTPDTVTSVQVLKGLFEVLWQRTIETQVMTGDLEALLDEVGAVLWIGDQALLHVHRPPPNTVMLDVGELWWDWCGLPLPFAVWACRKSWADQYPDKLVVAQRLLLASKAWGEANRAAVVQEAQRRLPLPADVLDDYYRHLDYELTSAHWIGLATLPGLLKLSLKAPVPRAIV